MGPKLLITGGRDPSSCNSNGHTPLHVTAANGHVYVVKAYFQCTTHGQVMTNAVLGLRRLQYHMCFCIRPLKPLYGFPLSSVPRYAL
ncbi:hypothetical protein BDN67DRAFT_706382 [Paxillus ammoniavirescens]|nr:hypothetical protein BDN67DRAFT_706382 [Paxillus ammoniavirescens]